MVAERVPMPEIGHRLATDWAAALDKLVDPGLALPEMPARYRPAAHKFIARYSERSGREFAVRLLTRDTFRIWRTK
jgi:hypothetical protein